MRRRGREGSEGGGGGRWGGEKVGIGERERGGWIIEKGRRR